MNPIRRVVIYGGHHKHPLFGPYAEGIQKRVKMFEALNPYRERAGLEPWRVDLIPGEKLLSSLTDPMHTLLVIPAGQSTALDKVFSVAQVTFLKDRFFKQGGRGYFTCGSAYWASALRRYSDVCLEQPQERKMIVKKSRLSLFSGIASGPHCPYPGHTYKVGFYSDTAHVISADGRESCKVLLSGGGSFQLRKGDPHVRPLVKYPHPELARWGKPPAERTEAEIAAIIVRKGKGRAVLSMFHGFYTPEDTWVDRYEEAFPQSGTNWRKVFQEISPQEERLAFTFRQMIVPLETAAW